MNMVRLDQSGRLGRPHEAIGLNHPDSSFAKFLLNTGDVRLSCRRGNVSPKIVAAKLQDNDFGAIWNDPRQSSQHATRCVSGYACIRNPQAGPPGLQHCL
jgi:hypothetical protein